MKKLILGSVLLATGCICTALIILAAVLSPLNPWDYNGITGWYAVVLGMKLQEPLFGFIGMVVIGALISVIEAFGCRINAIKMFIQKKK